MFNCSVVFHLFACGWLRVGRMDEGEGDVRIKGWVEFELELYRD